MNILAIIPARGGSKGIPRKNVAPLNGRPILAYTAMAARNSRLLDRTILSSNDPEIMEVARQLGIDTPFTRPEELARDDTPALPVIQHAVRFMEAEESYRADVIVLLQPTSPLRTEKHIDEALDIFLASKADSLVSVVEVPHSFNPYSVMRLREGRLEPFLEYDERRNLRQQKPEFYARNGAAIYVMTRECLLEKNSLYGDFILPYFMKKEDSIDIDDAWDLMMCEFLLHGMEKE